MKFIFDGHVLQQTDYYESTAFTRGQAWLALHDRVWHIMMPGMPRHWGLAQVGVVEAQDEQDGWMWCLDLEGQEYPLPMAQIHGERPRPPQRGGYWKRCGILYHCNTLDADRAAFGAVSNGLQSKTCELWVTNGGRVGYKPMARQ
ncbi:hypothetical protein WJU23_05400 [Prosthecobacter sp. SYSU 5D2]|uniref:hypothetical protein n=1 Tax=Prosthecobacter sp. SYSU 5D2 TaxID=3134134 RepID=UPI0031FED7B9